MEINLVLILILTTYKVKITFFLNFTKVKNLIYVRNVQSLTMQGQNLKRVFSKCKPCILVDKYKKDFIKYNTENVFYRHIEMILQKLKRIETYVNQSANRVFMI